MEQVKLPTCGRIVHFFPHPEKDKICTANNVIKLPATVIQDWGNLSINIQVQTMNPDALNVLRYSVCHLSEVASDADGNPLNSYWDWPKIG